MRKILLSIFSLVFSIGAGAAYEPGYGGNSDSNSRTGGQFVQGPNGPVLVGVPAGYDAGRAAATTTETTATVTATTASPSSDAAAASENNLEENIISIEDQAADEIKSRFALSFNKASQACPVVIDKINAIKVSAGINVATGVVGTIGGTTAAITGFMKSDQDKDRSFAWGAKITTGATKYAVGDKIKVLNIEELLEVKAVDGLETGKITELAVNAELLSKVTVPLKTDSGGVAGDIALGCLPGANNKDTSKLGAARTIGSFAAGGANVVGAGSVFIGLGQFDDAIKNIELCTAAIAEIEKQATELSFAKPTDSAIGTMQGIASACKGLDKKNIEDIKGKLTASGVISAIGAATGIVGGITSIQSNRNTAQPGAVESDKMGTTSNILAVATTAASLTSTIFSGVTLAGLNKNGEIADKCKAAFATDGIRPAWMTAQ